GVELTVAAEVAHRDGLREGAPRVEVHHRLKGTIAVAEQDTDAVPALVGEQDSGPAIAVDIDDEHPDRAAAKPRVETPRRLERSVTVAEQHRDGVRQRVGDHQIEPAIAGEGTGG